MTNIPHSMYNSIFPHIKLPTKSNLFPIAVANSQPPCINPWKRGGATLETNDNPMGLRNNSAIVSIRYELISQYGETLMSSSTAAPARSLGETRPRDEISTITNPEAAINIPIPIFLGEDGSLPFLFNHVKIPMTNGVNATINKGLND